MEEYDYGSYSSSSDGDQPQSTGATGATAPSSSQHGSKRRARFTEEERKDRRRTANRESARRMRAKRNEAMAVLQDSVGLLTKQNQQLQHENKAILKRLQRMEAENKSLRDRARGSSQDTGERQLAGARSVSKRASDAVTGAPQVSSPVDSEDGLHSTHAAKRRKTHTAAAAAGRGSSHGPIQAAQRSSSQGLKPVSAGHHSLRPAAAGLARLPAAEAGEHHSSRSRSRSAAAGGAAPEQAEAAQGWLPGWSLSHPGTPRGEVGPIRFPSDLQQQQQQQQMLAHEETAAAAAAALPVGAQHLHSLRHQPHMQLPAGVGLGAPVQHHTVAAAAAGGGGNWCQPPEAAASVASAPCFSRCCSGGEPLGMAAARRSSSWGNPANSAPPAAETAGAAAGGSAPQQSKKRRSWSPSDLLLGDEDILGAGDADMLGMCLDSPLLTAAELGQQQQRLVGSRGRPSPVLALGGSPVLPNLMVSDKQELQLCEGNWNAPGDLLDMLLDPPLPGAPRAAVPGAAAAAAGVPVAAAAAFGGAPVAASHFEQQQQQPAQQQQQQHVEVLAGVGDLARRLSDLGTTGGNQPSSSGPSAAPVQPAAAAVAGAAPVAASQPDAALGFTDAAPGKQLPAITAADVFGKRPQPVLPGLGALPWSLGGTAGGVPDAPTGRLQQAPGAPLSPMVPPSAAGGTGEGGDRKGSPGDGGLQAACNAYAALHAAWSQGLPGAPGAAARPAAAAPASLAAGQAPPAAAAGSGAVLPGLLAPLAGVPVPVQQDPLEQWAHKHAIPGAGGVGDLLDQVSSLLNMGTVPPPAPSDFGSGGSEGGQHRRRYPLKRPSKLALLGGAAGVWSQGQRQITGGGSGGSGGLHRHSGSGSRHGHHRHHHRHHHSSGGLGAPAAGVGAGVVEDWGGSAVGSTGRVSRRSEGGGAHSYLQQSSGQLSRHTGPHQPLRDGSGSPTAEHLGSEQQQQQQASPPDALQASLHPAAAAQGPSRGDGTAAMLLPSAFVPVTGGLPCSSQGLLGPGAPEVYGWAARASSPPASQPVPLVRSNHHQQRRYAAVAASELHGAHSAALSGAADGCRSFASDPGPLPAPSVSHCPPLTMDWAPAHPPPAAGAGDGAASPVRLPAVQGMDTLHCGEPQLQQEEEDEQQQHGVAPVPAQVQPPADEPTAAEAGPCAPCPPPSAATPHGALAPAAGCGSGTPCEEEDQGDWVDALSTLMQQEQEGPVQGQWAGQRGPAAAGPGEVAPANLAGATMRVPAAQLQCGQGSHLWQQQQQHVLIQQQQQVSLEAPADTPCSRQGAMQVLDGPAPSLVPGSSAMGLSWQQQQQQLWLAQQAWQQQQQLQQLLGLQRAASAVAAAGVSSGGGSSTCSLVPVAPEPTPAGQSSTPSAVASPAGSRWPADAVGGLEQMATYDWGMTATAEPLLYPSAAAAAATAGGGQVLLSQDQGQQQQAPVKLESARQQWEGAAAWQQLLGGSSWAPDAAAVQLSGLAHAAVAPQVLPPAAADAGGGAAAGEASAAPWSLLPLGGGYPCEAARGMAAMPPSSMYDTLQHLLGNPARPPSTNGSSGASGLVGGVSIGKGGFRAFKPVAQASSQEGSAAAAAAAEGSGQAGPSQTPPSS